MLSKQSGDRIVQNDLLQLLRTIPGERVMRPTWGTHIMQSLFDGIDDETIGSLQSNIVRAMLRYEPRITANVTVTADENNNTLTIRVEGTFTNEPNHLFEDELVLPLKRLES
ncbi:MAG: GPW/gp25 family protein [Anaerolineales bacterium]|nr:GPW/gp25 family protein [Anaerolineales bacterium]